MALRALTFHLALIVRTFGMTHEPRELGVKTELFPHIYGGCYEAICFWPSCAWPYCCLGTGDTKRGRIRTLEFARRNRGAKFRQTAHRRRTTTAGIAVLGTSVGRSLLSAQLSVRTPSKLSIRVAV